MTQKPDGFDPSDPIGAWRALRDANLDAWAKGMAQMTNSDAFAKTIGLQLDTMLAASAPIQKAVQQYMETYLAQVNMPSRGEVVSLAQRLTNIELRLDDMQAQLDELLAALRDRPATEAAPAAALPAPDPVPALEQRFDAMQSRLDDLLQVVRAQAAPPSPVAPDASAARRPGGRGRRAGVDPANS